jgi:hypothetical protein
LRTVRGMECGHLARQAAGVRSLSQRGGRRAPGQPLSEPRLPASLSSARLISPPPTAASSPR